MDRGTGSGCPVPGSSNRIFHVGNLSVLKKKTTIRGFNVSK